MEDGSWNVPWAAAEALLAMRRAVVRYWMNMMGIALKNGVGCVRNAVCVRNGW